MRARLHGLSLVGLVLICLSGLVQAGVDPAAVALLPAEAHIFCVAPSLDALERAERRLCDRLDTAAFGVDDLRARFAESPLEPLMAHAALGGPLLATMKLPMPGYGASPHITLVFRTDLSPADAAAVAAPFESSAELSVWNGDEGWMAVSTDPAYEPGQGDGARLADLPAGDLCLRLDFRALFEDYGALITMGLDMAEAAASAEPNGEAAAAQSVSPEMISALKPLVRALVASLDRFDMGLEADGETVALRTRLDMRPGSPLTPGPQPDFARARALTRAMPHDADVTQVSAFDYSRLLEVYMPLWRVSFRENLAAAGMDPEAAEVWLDGYLELFVLLGDPMAMTAEFGDGSPSTISISETPEAEAALDRIAAFLDTSTGITPGMSFEPAPARSCAGTPVRTWILSVDSEEVVSPLLEGDAPAGLPTAAAMMEMMPRHLSLAVCGERLLCALGDDPDALALPLERLRAGGGHEDTRIDRVAGEGDPGTRQVGVIDLQAYLSWFAGLIPGHGEALASALASEKPIRLPCSVSTSETRYAGRCELEMWEIVALWRALRTLDVDRN